MFFFFSCRGTYLYTLMKFTATWKVSEISLFCSHDCMLSFLYFYVSFLLTEVTLILHLQWNCEVFSLSKLFSVKRKNPLSAKWWSMQCHQCTWHGHNGLADLGLAGHHASPSHLWSASQRLPGQVQTADDPGGRLEYQRQTHPPLTSWFFERPALNLTFLITSENLTRPEGTLTPSRDKHAHALVINCLIFLLKIFILILI